MGAYVKLLEYDNIDGMILLSELSRRRIRSIQKLIRVGRNEVVVVLRVDKEKGMQWREIHVTRAGLMDLGYIDLSKRRVSAEDIVKCEERFNKGKMVASIMRHVAEKTKTPMETLYQDIAWPLNKKYGHAVDAFKLSITYGVPLPSPRPRKLTQQQKPRRLGRSDLSFRSRQDRTSILHLEAPHPTTDQSPRRRRSYLFFLRRYRCRQKRPPRRGSPEFGNPRSPCESQIGVTAALRIDESVFGEECRYTCVGEGDQGD